MELVEIRKLKDMDFYVSDIYAIDLVPRFPVFVRDSRPTSGFNYILEGEVEFIFNGVSHRYCSGDLVYLPKGSSYTYRTVTDTSRRIQLNFNLYNAHTNSQVIFSQEPICISHQHNQRFVQILMSLCSLSRSGGYAAGLHAKAEFLTFIYYLVYIDHSNYAYSSRANVVVRCIDDIKLDFSEDISTLTLCEKYGISPTHLRRLFKEKTGITVTEYINRCRIENSVKLLVNTDSSILDVALAVGYDSESYYCRIFKKITGQSPGRYRQLNSLQ